MALVAGPTLLDCGHSGHWISGRSSSATKAMLGPFSQTGNVNRKAIIVNHYDVGCGLGNKVVALTSEDGGATWSLVTGPTFFVQESVQSNAPLPDRTNEFSQIQSGASRACNSVYVTYCDSVSSFALARFNLRDFTFSLFTGSIGAPTFPTTPLGEFFAPQGVGPSGGSIVNSDGFGVLYDGSNNYSPYVPDDIQNVYLFSFDDSALTATLAATYVIGTGATNTFTVIPMVDDVDIFRIISATVGSPGLFDVLTWPDSDSAPTGVDAGVLNLRQDPGISFSLEANVLATPQFTEFGVALGVAYETRQPDNSLVFTYDSAVSNDLVGPLCGVGVVFANGGYYLIWYGIDNTGAPVIYIAQKCAGVWRAPVLQYRGPIATPSPGIPVSGVFSGNLVRPGSSEYEFVSSAANDLHDAADSTVCSYLWYNRVSLPPCSSGGGNSAFIGIGGM